MRKLLLFLFGIILLSSIAMALPSNPALVNVSHGKALTVSSNLVNYCVGNRILSNYNQSILTAYVKNTSQVGRVFVYNSAGTTKLFNTTNCSNISASTGLRACYFAQNPNNMLVAGTNYYIMADYGDYTTDWNRDFVQTGVSYPYNKPELNFVSYGKAGSVGDTCADGHTLSTATNFIGPFVTFEMQNFSFPRVTVLSHTNNSYITTTSSYINISFSGNSINSCWYSNNSGSTNITISDCGNITNYNFTEGTNNIDISINNTWGNKTTTRLTLTLDTINPQISFVTPTTLTGNYSQNWIYGNLSINEPNINNTKLIFFNSLNTSFCYQEDADILSSCGEIYIGSYAKSGVWDSVTNLYSNTKDGNWNTLGGNDGSGTSAYGFVNYTKPPTALNTSLWGIKDGLGVINLSISQCWNGDINKIILQYNVSRFNNSTREMGWSCWNGSQYINLRDTIDNSGNASLNDIYEEAMWWNISNIIYSTSSTSYNLTSLTDGVYNMLGQTSDIVGHINTTSTQTINLDTIAPTINVIYPINNSYYRLSTIDINMSFSDTYLNSCWLSLNGGTTNSSIPCSNLTENAVTDGVYNLDIWANDSVGNKGHTFIRFTIDLTNPQISFVSPTTTTGNYSQNWISGNISVVEINLNYTNIKLYNSSSLVLSTTQSFYNFTSLSDGTYYINATATDLAGNQNKTTTQTILLDITSPQISFVSPTTMTGYYSQNYINAFANVTDSNPKNLTYNFYNGIFLNSTTKELSLSRYCYQETANAATACGGLNTGVYGISESGPPIYINYSKPSSVTGAIWQTKFGGDGGISNLTIPDDCWNYNANVVSLQESSVDCSSAMYCYNGSDWKELASKYECGISGGYNTVNLAIDGSWDSNIAWMGGVTNAWKQGGTYVGSSLYEEAIWWDYYPTGMSYQSLSNGIYYLNATATDLAGNQNKTTTKIITLDTIYPIINLFSPLNQNYNYYPNFTYSIIETNFALAKYQLNGVNTSSAQILNSAMSYPEGNNSIIVYGYDMANNSNSSIVNFFIDTLYPKIDFITPTTYGGYYAQNWIYGKINVTDSNFVNTTFFLYNSTGIITSSINTSSISSKNFTSLSDGIYYMNATTSDIVNNINSTSTQIITLDTIYPIINLFSPLNQNYNYYPNLYSNITERNLVSAYYILNGVNTSLYNSNTPTCYQETANIATACGGLSTGSYSYTGSWYSSEYGWGFPTGAIDGNWSTRSSGDDECSGGGDLYINYTIPSNSLSSSIWQLALGSTFAYTPPTNISISSCLFTDKLQFKIHSGLGCQNVGRAYCLNSSSEWNLLYSSQGGVWEEAMWWNLNYINSNGTVNKLMTYPEGSNILTLYAIDIVNYTTSVTSSFTIDTISPTITITNPSTNGNYYNSVYVNYSAYDLNNINSIWFNDNNGINISQSINYGECYQESVNVSNQTGKDGNCGLSYSGNYNGNITGSSDFYINYTKPVNATSGIWKVKHGYGHDAYNITIPNDCWSANPTKVLLWGYVQYSTVYGQDYSYPRCYNGSDWKYIGNNYSDITGAMDCHDAIPVSDRRVDGDWDTYLGLCYRWSDVTIGQHRNENWYEEAMWWLFTQPFVNQSLTNTTWIQGVNNITIFAVDSYNNINFTTRNFIYDTIPGNISFTSNTLGNYSIALQNYTYIEVQGGDINFLYYKYYVYNMNGTLYYNTTTTNTYVNVTNMPEQNYYYYAQIYDLAGNINTTETRIIRLSFTSPSIVLNPSNEFNISGTSLIASYNNNLSLNVSFNTLNLNRSSISLDCAYANNIFYWEQNFTGGDYTYTGEANLTGIVPQTCYANLYATNGLNTPTNVTYTFYIGGTLNISVSNTMDNSLLTNYMITDNFNTIYNYTNAINLQTLREEIHTLTFSKILYFTKTNVLNITNIYQSIQYNTSQSIVHISVRQLKILDILPNTNVTLAKGAFSRTFNNGAGTIIDAYLDAGTYNVTVNSPGYSTYTTSLTMIAGEDKSVYIDLPFIAVLNLKDEKTFGVFNLTGVVVTGTIYCPGDITYTVSINDTTYSIPINCSYIKFKIDLDFGTAGNNYFRTYLSPPSSLLNTSYYLIDLRTSNAVLDYFMVDDLLKKYTNPSVWIYKKHGTQSVLITSDFIDVQRQIPAYLLLNSEYSIEIHSENQPSYVFGSYTATTAGTVSLKLYDIQLSPNPSDFDSLVYYDIGAVVSDGVGGKYIMAMYNDSGNASTSVTLTYHADGMDGPIIDQFTTTEKNFVHTATVPEQYKNSKIDGRIDVKLASGEDVAYAAPLQMAVIVNDAIEAIKLKLDSKFIGWIIIILLSVVALTFTIRTASFGAIILCGIAGIFILLQLFVIKNSAGTVISAAVLGLASAIAFVTFLREKSVEA